MRLSMQPVNLTTAIEAAVEMVRPSVDTKGIALETIFPSGDFMVIGDPPRLQQVFWNLMSNAVKFTSAGKITIELKRMERHALFTVTDTGQGIAPDFVPHVFDRFRQADSSTMRRFGGLGIGLALVKEIVHLHGGRVWVDSSGLGKGATFGVQIPLIESVEQKPVSLDSLASHFDQQNESDLIGRHISWWTTILRHVESCSASFPSTAR